MIDDGALIILIINDRGAQIPLRIANSPRLAGTVGILAKKGLIQFFGGRIDGGLCFAELIFRREISLRKFSICPPPLDEVLAKNPWDGCVQKLNHLGHGACTPTLGGIGGAVVGCPEGKAVQLALGIEHDRKLQNDKDHQKENRRGQGKFNKDGPVTIAIDRRIVAAAVAQCRKHGTESDQALPPPGLIPLPLIVPVWILLVWIVACIPTPIFLVFVFRVIFLAFIAKPVGTTTPDGPAFAPTILATTIRGGGLRSRKHRLPHFDDGQRNHPKLR